MEIRNTAVLDRFTRRHRDSQAWIAAWIRAIEAGAWRNIDELRERFPAADGVRVRSGAIVTVFNVKGNEYRLLAAVLYARQLVIVIDVLTHAEYSKSKPD